MKNVTILILGLVLIITSCGTQKRLHRKGYHFNTSSPLSIKQKGDISTEKFIHFTNTTTAETNHYSALVETKQPADTCDEIILTDGTIIRGKVLEFMYNKVHYKLCDYPNRPSQMVSKVDVFLIKYANGNKENFGAATQPPVKIDTVTTKTEKKEDTTLSVNTPVKPDPTDEIILLNGEIIKGNIGEISDETVKYKKANHLDGPTYILQKSEILLVQFKDGTTEVINQNTTPKPAHQSVNDSDDKEFGTGNLSRASFVLGLIGVIPLYGLPLSILAIIFSSIALWRIKHLFPNSLITRKGQAIAGLVLGILAVITLGILLLVYA